MIQEVLENGFYDLRRDPETSQSPSGYSFVCITRLGDKGFVWCLMALVFLLIPENGKQALFV